MALQSQRQQPRMVDLSSLQIQVMEEEGVAGSEDLLIYRITDYPLMIQNFDLSCVNVSFTPLCLTFLWQSMTISLQTGCHDSNSMGNLVSWGKSAFSNLPLHRINPLSSKNRPNCNFQLLPHCKKESVFFTPNWVCYSCSYSVHNALYLTQLMKCV